ncbi:MAG: HlyD family efflux transporter periplasmic adaptor subunit [Saprospiraceae bacterium]|nr:HlyD family efflux transporter periplasmic adaptor subunit [Saprospiraceae bacterium]
MPDYIKIEEEIEVAIKQPAEVSDLIGNPPGWILRSGISVIALVVAIGLAISYMISYPDKIMAPVIITTENPPVDLVSNASGKISELYITDNDTVDKNDTILYLENNALPEDIKKVENFIAQYENVYYIPDYLKLSFEELLQTGELNSNISTFAQKLRSFQNLLRQSLIFQKLKSLDNEIARTRKLTQIQEKELNIYQNEVEIKTKEYNRNEILHKQKVISDADIEKAEAELLVYQRNYESMRSGIINNNIRVEQLKTQQIALTDQRHQSVSSYINELAELIVIIKNDIETWKKKYYVISPAEGIVSMPGALAKDQFINQAVLVCSIVPATKANNKIARAMTPISGTGKIEKGARVIIRFDAYPYKEYGTIETSVDKMALLPTKDKDDNMYYELTFDLPEMLKTNYEKKLTYKPNMSGTALIITEDRTLLERFFDKFLNLTRNN